MNPWSNVVTTRLRLGGRTLAITHPANSDDLIEEEQFVIDERMPYWADIWPASRVLAERVMQEHGGGRSLIELGCGLGLVSVAGVLAGFEVLATDYYSDALEFARHNVRANMGRELRTKLYDWCRDDPPSDACDVVVASDVLYEHKYAEPLADAMAALLRSGGRAIVADPGRVAAAEFLRLCDANGVALEEHGRVDVESAGRPTVVDVYEFVAR